MAHARGFGTSSKDVLTINDRRFTTTLMRPSELFDHPSLLKQLTEIVNQAYIGTHLKLEKDLNVEPHSIFTGLRLQTETQLAEELPEDSLIALMFDVSDDEVHSTSFSACGSEDSREDQSRERTGNNKESVAVASEKIRNGTVVKVYYKLVAVASIKKWKGTVMKKYYQSLSASHSPFPTGSHYPPRSILEEASPTDPNPSKYHDWEIATCACVDDKKYRGIGLVSRLTSILLDQLRDQYQRDEQYSETIQTDSNGVDRQDDNGDSSSQNTKALPIRLWVSALGGSYNVDYWTKRGYTAQGDHPDTAPPGVWDNAVDVQIWTLSKVVD